MPVSYYDILNVSYTASVEEIKSSFRKMVKLYHPDLSDFNNASAKFGLILKAYRVLSDEGLKKIYDEKVLNSHVLFENGIGYVKIPKSRIDYAASLKNLASSGLLAQKKIKRKYRLANFGYDISVKLLTSENRRGAVLRFSLPAKGVCHVCYGSDMSCYLCDGLGSVLTVEDLEVLIPPNVPDQTVFDINLRENPPSKLSYFTLESVRILLQVAD